MSNAGPPPDFEGPSYGSCNEVTPWCPISATIYGSYFNFPAMLFFSILYFLLLIVHAFLGYHYRTYSFSAWVVASCILELLGHVGRTAMVYNPWSIVLLSLQICGLLWGPTLVAAGVSIAFKHMVHYCGTQHSPLPPRLIPWLFVGTDIFSVLIQGIGGIVASVSSGEGNGTSLTGQVGENMMIAGVCFQIANMLVCSTVMLVIWRRYQTAQKTGGNVACQYLDEKAVDSKVQKRFTWFARAASVAFGCILIRCIYRVAEMAGGWANPVMRNEPSFIVLDST
jgi:hypothetical protein